MARGDRHSRRRVLKRVGALVGSIPLTKPGKLLGQTEPRIYGWITKGNKTDITDQEATIEKRLYRGMTQCNDGDVFKCRTCTDVTYFLLVPADSTHPTVGETYRFSLTGDTTRCGNFRVRLSNATTCNPTRESTMTDSPTSTEPTTTTTETTTTDATTTDTTTRETTTTEPTATDTPTRETTTTDADPTAESPDGTS